MVKEKVAWIIGNAQGDVEEKHETKKSRCHPSFGYAYSDMRNVSSFLFRGDQNGDTCVFSRSSVQFHSPDFQVSVDDIRE